MFGVTHEIREIETAHLITKEMFIKKKLYQNLKLRYFKSNCSNAMMEYVYKNFSQESLQLEKFK